MRASRCLVVPAGLILVAACGDEPITDVDLSCSDDTGSVTVTVSGPASTPQLDWSPPCPVALLLVERGASDTWSIATDETTWDDPAAANLITPPITYGVAPASAADEYGPDPLVIGQPHEAILWRIPPGSTAGCASVAFGACMLALHEWTP